MDDHLPSIRNLIDEKGSWRTRSKTTLDQGINNVSLSRRRQAQSMTDLVRTAQEEASNLHMSPVRRDESYLAEAMADVLHVAPLREPINQTAALVASWRDAPASLTDGLIAGTSCIPQDKDSLDQDESFTPRPSVTLEDVVSRSALSTSHSIRPEGITYNLVRFPMLIFICLVLVFDLIMYILLRQTIRLLENFRHLVKRGTSSTAWRLHQIRRQLRLAKTYNSWWRYASEADQLLGRSNWTDEEESPFYDYHLIREARRSVRDALRKVKRSVSANDGNNILLSTQSLMQVLLENAVRRNLGGVENPRLYSFTYAGTKKLIESFVDDVVEALQWISDSDCIESDKKNQFFKQVSQKYGRTALCLSGGATLGFYHLGVVRALLKSDSLPRVISGTSAGSLIAAFVCVHTDRELRAILDDANETNRILQPFDDTFYKRLQRLFREGVWMDANAARQRIRQYITMGDMTFLEAYHRTGRVLNISVVAASGGGPAQLLNYITAPHVVIHSAILASSAVPFLLPQASLLFKPPPGSEPDDAIAFISSSGDSPPLFEYRSMGHHWRDGSFQLDIPTERLNQQFNIHYTIVSQTNPLVTLFFYEALGSAGHPSGHRSGKGWRGGFLASAFELALKLDMRKWLRLVHGLHLLPITRSLDISALVLQRFTGTVTIYPAPDWKDYLYLVTNLGCQRMALYASRAESRTWPKLAMINNRIRIERVIDRQMSKRRRMRRPSTNSEI